MIAALLALALAAGVVAPEENSSAARGAASDPGYRFALALARAGPRPAGSAAERRAHARVERRLSLIHI